MDKGKKGGKGVPSPMRGSNNTHMQPVASITTDLCHYCCIALGRDAKYCHHHVCMSVCLSTNTSKLEAMGQCIPLPRHVSLMLRQIHIHDPDHHQNLIIFSLAYCRPSLKISCKSYSEVFTQSC